MRKVSGKITPNGRQLVSSKARWTFASDWQKRLHCSHGILPTTTRDHHQVTNTITSMRQVCQMLLSRSYRSKRRGRTKDSSCCHSTQRHCQSGNSAASRFTRPCRSWQTAGSLHMWATSRKVKLALRAFSLIRYLLLSQHRVGWTIFCARSDSSRPGSVIIQNQSSACSFRFVMSRCKNLLFLSCCYFYQDTRAVVPC